MPRIVLPLLGIFLFSASVFGEDQLFNNKLVVVVVVDQLRPEALLSSKLSYKAGLKHLPQRSAFFPRAHFSHVPTETAPGHAVIATGFPPAKTGIIGNDWYNSANRKKLDCDRDEKGEYGPFQLNSPTLGDLLKKSSPRSKVVSVSFKNRAAVIMGGKNADAVFWFDKKRREFTTSPYYGASPHWLASFNKNIQPLIPWWPKLGHFLLSPDVDNVTLSLALQSIQQYDLGQDDDCDLLWISFSATDNIGHWYGPNSPEMDRQLANLDVILGRLLEQLDKTCGDHYSLVLTSDHSVLPMPEEESGKKMGAKRVSKKKLLESFEMTIEKEQPGGPWILEVLYPDIYFDRNRIKEKGYDWDNFLTAAGKAIKKVYSVAQVYTPPHFPEKDLYTDIYRRSYAPDRSGDLYIRLEPGVLATDSKSNTNHGTVYDYDSVVPVLFFGKSFNTRTFDQTISMEDIAPTCAHLLSIALTPSDKGRILTEIFSKK